MKRAKLAVGDGWRCLNRHVPPRSATRSVNPRESNESGDPAPRFHLVLRKLLPGGLLSNHGFQRGNCLGVTLARGEVQGSVATYVLCVDVGADRYERIDGASVALKRGEV